MGLSGQFCGCVALGKALFLPEPPFSHLKVGTTEGLELGNSVSLKGLRNKQWVCVVGGQDYPHHLSLFITGFR